MTDVVRDYAATKGVNEAFLLVTPQRQMSSSMPAALRAWLSKRVEVDPFAEMDEDAEDIYQHLGPLTRAIVERSDEFVDLDELIANDSKYARLRKIVAGFFGQHPDAKIVLFSSFRATLAYLAERLREDGFSTIQLTGETKTDKADVIDTFADPNGPQILLSSEVGGEGVDLQFSWVVINYDLPWNPMRVEQRIGRVDRLGQEAEKVLIWNLFYDDTIDSRIYEKLYEKLDLCRQALGDFEAVLGDKIRQLTVSLLRGHLTPEQEAARIDQTAQALQLLKQDEERLEADAAQLMAYGDYILRHVNAARELKRWVTPEDLRSYGFPRTAHSRSHPQGRAAGGAYRQGVAQDGHPH